ASATSYASSIVYGAIDAKVCSRSHGQPRSGSRSVAMISSSRASSSRSRWLIGQHFYEGLQHRGRRAPDQPTGVLELVHPEAAAEPLAIRRAQRARREHDVERHLEHVRDLAWVRLGTEVAADEADDRRHREAGAGHVRRQTACDLDRALRHPDFLPRLAQRRMDHVLALVDASARKADL